MTGMNDLCKILLDCQAILVRLVEAIFVVRASLLVACMRLKGDYLNMVTDCACAKIDAPRSR